MNSNINKLRVNIYKIIKIHLLIITNNILIKYIGPMSIKWIKWYIYKFWLLWKQVVIILNFSSMIYMIKNYW